MEHLTPLKAIRKKCLNCSGFSTKEVRDCPSFETDGGIEYCFLYPYRLGKRPKQKTEFTPIKSIRKYCLWCCCGNKKLVKECPTIDCPLWIYRLGGNPNRKGIGRTFKIPFKLKKSIVELGEEKGFLFGNIKPLLVKK